MRNANFVSTSTHLHLTFHALQFPSQCRPTRLKDTIARRSPDLHAIAAALADADRDDTDTIDLRPSTAYRVASGLEQPFKKMTASLFNFNSTHWVQHIAGFASLSLDEELELHELLDYDAAASPPEK